MTSLDLTDIKETIDQLRNDDSFNAIGKLNLAAYLGGRAHFLVAEIERLRTIESDLLEALEYGAGAQDGPTFLEFVAWQLEERDMLDATATALRRKAQEERAAISKARGEP